MRSVLALTFCCLLAGAATARAQEARPAAGKLFALVVGIDKYQHVPRVDFGDLDARLMAETLVERAGARPENIRLLSDSSPAERRPTKAVLTAALSKFLGEPQEADQVLVFFAGHGMWDDGKTYLVALDSKADNTDSMIPLDFVRGLLESCKAERKLFVVDACHSGNAAGIGPKQRLGLTKADLEAGLGNENRVYTLASCQADELSISHKPKSQGLYTYWLSRGLAGAADADGDGVILADELHQFVEPLVKKTAQREYQHPQSPARIVPPQSKTPVLPLEPESETNTLARVAELLHEQAVEAGVKSVGVFELSNLASDGSERLARYPFGTVAADRIEELLRELSAGKYAVVDRKRLVAASKEADLEVLGSAAGLGKISQGVGGMEAVVVGNYFLIEGPPMRLRVVLKLIGREQGNVIASATRVIHLNAALRGLVSGGSGKPKPAADPAKTTARLASRELFPFFTPPGENLEPLTGDAGPVQLEVWSAGVRKPVRTGEEGELLLNARPDEEFEIRLVNRTGDSVFARLLIDGVNVLGRKSEALNSARPFVLGPQAPSTVKGWHEAQNGAWQVSPFRFVEPPAARDLIRKKFGQPYGVITAQFYKARPMAWVDQLEGKLGVGDVPAKRYIQTFPKLSFVVGGQKLEGACMGEPLAFINLRYVREPAASPK